MLSVALVALMIVLAFGATEVRSESLGSKWLSSSTYSPAGIDLQSCVYNADFAAFYCVGGNDGTSYTNVVQHASVSPPGTVQGWTATTAYPLSTAGESCAALSVYLYCVGGYNGASRSNAVYYAQPSQTGIGSWTAAISYPIFVNLLSCVVQGTYLYCIGGYDGSKYYNSTDYAQLSTSGGLASWTSSTGVVRGNPGYPTPIGAESCVTYSGYLYCIGGYNGNQSISSVYYTSFQGSGALNHWSNTTAYPFATYGVSCAAQSGYIYCVGGYSSKGYSNSTYYANILPSGALGSWVQTTTYPSDVVQQSCSAYDGYLYCIGGFDGTSVLNGVYSDSISSVTPTTVTATSTTTVFTPPTVTVTSTSTYFGLANQTVTTTMTSTSAPPVVYSTVTSTQTVFSFSAFLTTTVTSTAKIPSGETTTSTTTVTAEVPVVQSSFPLPLMAGVAAAGLVIGVVVSLVVSRLRGRGGSETEESQPS
jgi:hypothetical protein